MDLRLIDAYDRLVTDLELALVPIALAVVTILALVLLDEIHDINRFPRVQEFVSYGRLLTCAKQSAGKRAGTSGATIGHAYLTRAFSEAAVLCLRHHPAAQKYLARFERRHGKGKALTVLAHTLARAVYAMLKRDTACDWDKFLHNAGIASFKKWTRFRSGTTLPLDNREPHTG